MRVNDLERTQTWIFFGQHTRSMRSRSRWVLPKLSLLNQHSTPVRSFAICVVRHCIKQGFIVEGERSGSWYSTRCGKLPWTVCSPFRPTESVCLLMSEPHIWDVLESPKKAHYFILPLAAGHDWIVTSLGSLDDRAVSN